jgi:iron complex outermembrane receptor protein
MGLETVAALTAMPFCLLGPDGAAHGPNAEFQIEAQSLRTALQSVSQQASLNLFVAGKPPLDEMRAPALHGWYSFSMALDTLLAGTGLTYRFVSPCQVQIEPGERSAAEIRGIRARAESASADRDVFAQEGAPEILVRARHALNADVRRTKDDIQPYVVIDHEQIERSQADSVESLINRYVTANLSSGGGQSGGIQAGRSQLNLRGLGSNETLVLVDGRRVAAPFVVGSPTQADLTAIPLAAVERIEILPTTASAIYGGGATGGVVNIILRHDCETRLVAAYGNSFAADTANRRGYLSHCLSFGEGRTQMRVAGSFSQEAELLTGQRDFARRGRSQIVANNASFFVDGASPPLGAQTNLRTKDGSGLNGPGSPSFTTVPAGYTSADGLGPLLENAGRYNLNLAGSAQADGGGRYALRNGPVTRYLNATLNHQFSKRLSAYVDLTNSRNVVQRPANIAEYAGLEGVLVPAAAPNNPVQQDLVVTVPAIGGDRVLENRLGSRGITAGLTFTLPRAGHVGLEYTSWTWELERKQPAASSAAEDVAAGKVDVFRDMSRQPLDLDEYALQQYVPSLKSRSDVATLRFGCSRFDAPAGTATLSALLEYRDERFGGGTEFVGGGVRPPIAVASYTKQRRRITSGYAETRIPLWSRGTGTPAAESSTQIGRGARGRNSEQQVGGADGAPSVEMQTPDCGSSCCAGAPGGAFVLASELEIERETPWLELQLAGRFDGYRVESAQPRVGLGSPDPVLPVESSFTSLNPTIGLQFWPSAGVSFRWSFGTGFLPPSGDQFAPGTPTVFGPESFRDLRRGNELTGVVHFRAGGNPDLHPERSRSWSAGVLLKPAGMEGLRFSLDYVRISKVDDIVSPAALFFLDPVQFEIVYPDRVTRGPRGVDDPYEVAPITDINATDLNIARSTVEAWDAAVEYEVKDSWVGDVGFWARATREPTLRMRATPSSPDQNLAGVSGNALKFAGVAGLTVRRGDWEFGWSTRYFGPYVVGLNAVTIANQGGREVSSQTYHDASVSYRFGERGDAAMSVVVLLTAQNLLNRRPPFDAGAASFSSVLGDARMGTYGVTVTAVF